MVVRGRGGIGVINQGHFARKEFERAPLVCSILLLHLNIVEESIVEEVLLSSSTLDEFDVVGSHGKAKNGWGTFTVSLTSIIYSILLDNLTGLNKRCN